MSKAKKLYRSSSDQMIAGVCAGVAHFLGIDPSIVRLLFILFLFLGGSGFLVYLVMWIVVPLK